MPVNLPWLKKKDDDGGEHLEVRLPDEIKKQLDDSAAASKAADEKIASLIKSQETIMAFINGEKEEKEQRKAELLRQRQTEHQTEVDEEIQDLIVSDPKKAIEKATEKHSVAIMTLRADNLKREIFEDAEKFPYYTGDIKAKIDQLLDGQSLAAKNDRGVIENTYYSIVGRHEAEIRENKLKTRFASPESNRGNAGGNQTNPGDSRTPEITDEIKRIAKMFDMKPEEYAKQLQEEGII